MGRTKGTSQNSDDDHPTFILLPFFFLTFFPTASVELVWFWLKKRLTREASEGQDSQPWKRAAIEMDLEA